MPPKQKQYKEDLINEPKVVALAGQSYLYGQTPAALCRQHFKEIAERLHLTVEELARSVLDQSLDDQLHMLQDFYKSKNQETKVIFQPLLELCLAEVDNDKIPEKSPKKKSKTGKTATSLVQKKKSCTLLLSSDSDSEEKTNRDDPVLPIKTMERDRQLLKRQPLLCNKTLSRIDNSIEATVAYESTFSLEKDKINDNHPKPSNKEPEITNFEVNTVEVKPLNDSQSNETFTKKTGKEPPVVIEHNDAPMKEEGSQEDLEIFLYGESPTRSKPPPRKKYHQYPLSETITAFDAFDSPSSSQFCPPALTFEPNSSSPTSRQRDLLSIARDIAALQKVVASGKKLHDSVSDTIKFTNPTE